MQPRRVYLRPARQVAKAPRVPGAYVNPNVVNWYYQNAFIMAVEEDDMSKKYPWLFGEKGLYNMKCRFPCYISDGACVCPE